MIASRYALQIFWVLATALVYTLLALAVSEKDENDEQSLKVQQKNVRGCFLEWRPTHNSLDRIDSP